MMFKRPGRVLGVLLAAATLMAGCQCAAPPPTSAAMRPFVGDWYASTSGMTITSSGQISVEMKDISVVPFDYLAFDLTAISVDGNRLRARVVKSDSRRVPVGSIFSFKPTWVGLEMSGPIFRGWCTWANHQQAACGGWGA